MSSAEQFLKLQDELTRYRAIMGLASSQMLDQEVTKYPIFIVHQQEVQLGVPLVTQDNDTHKWSIHASTLEEFNVKGLVPNEKVDEFRKVFKDPQDFFCIFVISELGAQFVFLPQQGD